MVVVDTSALISLLKGRDTPAARRVENLSWRGDSILFPLIVCQELLQGARDTAEWKLIEEYLSTQEVIEPLHGWDSYRDAARIYFDLRKKGLTVRSSQDCLIAQLAIERGIPLLHEDRGFETIAKVRPLRFA